jgi:hypothetical protein
MAKKIEDVISGIEDKLDIIFEELTSKYQVTEEECDATDEDESEDKEETDESESVSPDGSGFDADPKKVKVKATAFGDKKPGSKGSDADDAGFDGDKGPEGDDAEPVKESVGNFVDSKEALKKTAVNKGGTDKGKVGNIQVAGWKKGTPVAGKDGKVTGNATKDNKNLADKGSSPDAEQKGSSEKAGFDGKAKTGKNLTTGAINKGNKGFGSKK